MTSPDPVPLPPLPLAAIVTTEGMTWSATAVTAHALTVWEEPDVGLGAGELVRSWCTRSPPSRRPAQYRLPSTAATGVSFACT